MAIAELGTSIPVPLGEGGVDSPEIRDRNSHIYDDPVYRSIFTSWVQDLNQSRVADGKPPIEDNFDDLKRRVDTNPADTEAKQLFWFVRNDAEHVFRETVNSLGDPEQLRKFLTNRGRLLSGTEPNPREIDQMIQDSQRVGGSMQRAINEQDKRLYVSTDDDPSFEYAGYLASLDPDLKTIQEEIDLLRIDHRGTALKEEELAQGFIPLRLQQFAVHFPAKARVYALKWEDYANTYNIPPATRYTQEVFDALSPADQQTMGSYRQMAALLHTHEQRQRTNDQRDDTIERARGNPSLVIRQEWDRVQGRLNSVGSNKNELLRIAKEEGITDQDIGDVVSIDPVGLKDAILRAKVTSVGRQLGQTVNALTRFNERWVNTADRQRAVDWLIDKVGGVDINTNSRLRETVYGEVHSLTLDEIEKRLDTKLWQVMGSYRLDWGNNSAGLSELLQAMQSTTSKDEDEADDFIPRNEGEKAQKERELARIRDKKTKIVIKTLACINLHSVRRGYDSGAGGEAYSKNHQAIDYEQQRLIIENTAGVAVFNDLLKENDGAYYRKEEAWTDANIMFNRRNAEARQRNVSLDLRDRFKLLEQIKGGQRDGKPARPVDWNNMEEDVEFANAPTLGTGETIVEVTNHEKIDAMKIWVTQKKLDVIRIKEEQDDKLIKTHKRTYINRQIANREDGITDENYRDNLIKGLGDTLDDVMTTAFVLDYYNQEQVLNKSADKQPDIIYMHKAFAQLRTSVDQDGNRVALTDNDKRTGPLKFFYLSDPNDPNSPLRDDKEADLLIDQAIKELADIKHEADFAFVLAEDEYYLSMDAGKYDGARWKASAYTRELDDYNKKRKSMGLPIVRYMPNLARPKGAILTDHVVRDSETGVERIVEDDPIDLMEFDRAKESLEYMLKDDNGHVVPETDASGNHVFEKDSAGRVLEYQDENGQWRPKIKYKFDQAKYNKHRGYLTTNSGTAWKVRRTPAITEAIDRAERTFYAKHQDVDLAIERTKIPADNLVKEGVIEGFAGSIKLPTGHGMLSGDGRMPTSPKRIQHANWWVTRPQHTNFTDTGAPKLAAWFGSSVQSLTETTGRFDVNDQAIEWQADISPINSFWLQRVVGGEEYRKTLTDKAPFLLHSANAQRNRTVETMGKIIEAKSYESIQERQEEAAHSYEGILRYNMYQIKKDSSRHKYMSIIEVDNVLRDAVGDGQLGLGQYKELKNRLMWDIPFLMDFIVINNKLKKVEAIEDLIWQIIKAASKGMY